MSVLGFTMTPGGVCFHENADNPAALGPYEPFTPDEVNAVTGNTSAPAPAPVRPTGSEISMRGKVIAKLQPGLEMMREIRSLELGVSDTNERLAVLNKILDAARMVSNDIFPLVAKFSVPYNRDIHPLEPVMGMITMHRADIAMVGLDRIQVTCDRFSPSVEAIVSNVGQIVHCESIIRRYDISSNDIWNQSTYHDVSNNAFGNTPIFNIVEKLCDYDTSMSMYTTESRTVNLDDMMFSIRDKRSYGAEPVNYQNRLNCNFANDLSCNLRWVMTEAYGLICDLADHNLSDELFTNMSMRLCATVCNLFSIAVLKLFDRMVQIGSELAYDNAAWDLADSIRTLISSTAR